MTENYITPLAAGLLDIAPLDAALHDWIMAAPDDGTQIARAKVALACVDLIAEHMAREVLAAEITEARTNVVGLFEQRARRDWHPSMGDDAPVHGYPRPSAEAQEQAAEEMRHDIAMGRYWDEPGA